MAESTASKAPRPTKPAAPTTFRITNPTVSTLTLAWAAPSGTVTQYGFEERRSDGTWRQVGLLPFGHQNWVHRNLEQGTGHTYRMRAQNSAGWGGYSAEASGTTIGAAQIVAGPSGVPMPTADPAGWRRVLADDFTEDVPLGSFPEQVSARWSAYPFPWPDTTDKGTYDPHRVLSQHNSCLDYYMHTASDGRILCGAPLPRLNTGSNAYYGAGLMSIRWAVRFKADPMSCMKAAWLLWPDVGSNLPNGEIDFPEGDFDSTIWGFMHRDGATANNDQDYARTDARFTEWHTATMEWIAGKSCVFWLDGNEIGRFTSRVPKVRMHPVFQSEVALSGCTPDPSTAGHVLIDWACFWTQDAP